MGRLCDHWRALAKFTHEADDDALAAAVERYDVRHPSLNDAEMATWNAYAVRAWPTLIVIDPERYIVSTMSGKARPLPGSRH